MSTHAPQLVSNILEGAGVDHYGFSPLKRPLNINFYKDWLNEGFHGEMEYLERHLPIKEDPSRLLEKSKWAIVVAKSYLPTPEPTQEDFFLKEVRIANYAKGKDYHLYFKAELDKIIVKLRDHFPNHNFVSFTDSGPVLERDLAFQAGLGWYGKNTCLIHKDKGSFFFIGEIITSLELGIVRDTHPDRCGQCTRCIEACPTDALVEPYKLDATKCISYWTIESKKIAPKPIRKKMGDWLFGCDICQSVCPWNEKAFGKEMMLPEQAEVKNSVEGKIPEGLIQELGFILQSSSKKLEKLSFGTPLSRPRGSGLKRNALIVIGNLRIKELSPDIEPYLSHPKLGELAQWAMSQIH